MIAPFAIGRQKSVMKNTVARRESGENANPEIMSASQSSVKL